MWYRLFQKSRLITGLIALSSLTLCACNRTFHAQSVMHPSGPAAEEIHWLTWLLFLSCGAVLAGVIVLLVLALLSRRGSNIPLGGHRFVLWSGVIIPSFILIGILFASLQTTFQLQRPKSGGPHIQVIGHQWWWEVRYLDEGQKDGFVTANELVIPVGEPVHLELEAEDVIHSFWVPNLHGKMDMVPGKTNHFWIQADQPARYRGQCAEYCGLQHAWMAFTVDAVSPEEYQQWVRQQTLPRPVPLDDSHRLGQQVYFKAACHNCHAIRDTAADGRIGPDLSAIGSRPTLGAGRLPNNRGNLTGWIADPQALKPGARMPPSYLKSEELEALVDYLMTLE